jgi:hypothetical protein
VHRQDDEAGSNYGVQRTAFWYHASYVGDDVEPHTCPLIVILRTRVETLPLHFTRSLSDIDGNTSTFGVCVFRSYTNAEGMMDNTPRHGKDLDCVFSFFIFFIFFIYFFSFFSGPPYNVPLITPESQKGSTAAGWWQTMQTMVLKRQHARLFLWQIKCRNTSFVSLFSLGTVSVHQVVGEYWQLPRVRCRQVG